jgi:hypothetical protein
VRLDASFALAAILSLWLAQILTSLAGVRWPIPAYVQFGLWLGIPVLVTGAALLSRREVPWLPLACGFAWALVGALFLAPFFTGSLASAAVVPAIFLSAWLTHRYPATALVAMFVLCSAYGTIQAFLNVSPGQVVDLILVGLWLGVVGRMVLGHRDMGVRPTLATMLIAAFLVMTLGAMLTAGSESLSAFRIFGWHLSALLLVALGPFDDRTFERVGRALALAILVIGAYATYRWGVGQPAEQEADLILGVEAGLQYDTVGTGSNAERKLIGSFPNGAELGLWTACTIPFLLAMVLGARGHIRLASMAALPLTVIAMLGSNQRNAAASVAVGAFIILVVHLLSRGFPGPRLGVALVAVVVAVTSVVALYPRVIDNPEKRERYERLLRPAEDPSVQERFRKWGAVITELRGHPFGFGLGAATIGVGKRLIRPGADHIDSSYFKVAYEQGLFVAAFFVVALLILLVELLRHAVWSRAPGISAMTTASAGTLVSMMVQFLGGIHIDSLAVVVGWMIVGLGVAQYARDRNGSGQRLVEP